MSIWSWEEIDAGRSGSSGDLAKMFKNEPTKQPGVLGIGAPPADATVLAREAIQNSWDAGIALRTAFDADGLDAPEFRLRFEYRDLIGTDKERLIGHLGLRELAARAGGPGRRRKLGLAETDCLDHLDDDTPLRVLCLDESGTTGMGGAWSGTASKLYLALVSIGFTIKAEGSGGSYGYGKAGLIRGSAIHSVVAHTCFREERDDPGVTRRLLGMTYWGLHDVDDVSYTGFARLGTGSDGVIAPFENDTADDLAARLGLRLRDPQTPEDLGSTFLLVDPVVDPEDLRRAVERNWWPALFDNLIDVEIEGPDGRVHIPRPRKDPVLATFIRGFELATTAQDNQPPNELRRDLRTYTPRGGDTHQLGHIGLVADLGGWSYEQSAMSEDGEDPVDHRSLVALVRGPRMVVEYYSDRMRGQPYVRGTFIAHDGIDDLLRQTEPKAHDAWLPKLEEEGIDSSAPVLAKELLRRIRETVRDFKKQLKPPPPREQDIRLPVLDDLLKGIVENRGGKHAALPPGDPRPISISSKQTVETAGGDAIRMRASARFHLTEHHTEDEATVSLRFRCAFDEDGALGSDCPLDLGPLPGDFDIVSVDDQGTTVVGTLGRDDAEFTMVTAPYDMDWSTQFIVVGDVAAGGAMEGGIDDEQ